MKRPIFRILASYELRNKGIAVARKVLKGRIDTFMLTDNTEELKSDKDFLNKICRKSGRSLDKVDIVITSIEIEGKYGFTNK